MTKKRQPIARDGAGRFAKGGAGGPGRPRRERERDFARAFDAALPPAELTKAVRAVLLQAQQGSVAALRLLLQYSIGLPTQKIEIEPSEEYRVAGQSPAEGMAETIAYINRRAKERIAYEAKIAAQRTKTNGAPRK